jgi:hypothetical protein
MPLPHVRTRIVIAVAIGIAAGILTWLFLSRFDQGAGDFGWAIRAARYLFRGQNPYDTPLEQYPITAAVFALPFISLRPEIAGAAFYGISSALLALGLTRKGYHRLLVFLAYPYWAGMIAVQWSPLLMAAALFPLLLPATMAKPQIGLPIAANYFTRRGAIASVFLLLLTILVLPRWPLWWIRQFGNYQHFIPIFVFPGPFIILALLRWRDQHARFLFLTSLMPQRWFFDSFILWLIPNTRRELVWTILLSWLPGIWRWYFIPRSFTEVGRWAVMFFYLPMLAIIWMRSRKPSQEANVGAVACKCM